MAEDVCMKSSVFAALYWKLGEGLGLLDPHVLGEADAARAKRIKDALDGLEEMQRGWRKRGLTANDIREAIDEGRA